MAFRQRRCPHCGSQDIRDAQFKGFDLLLFLLLFLPHRCLSCHKRFWRLVW